MDYFYMVKATTELLYDNEPDTAFVPDCDVPYKIIRYYRREDGCFVIMTEQPIKKYEKKLTKANKIVSSRLNWWNQKPKDKPDFRRNKKHG